ncbi:MAG: hypothetical protein C4332_10940 [Meiothermus sp.]
MPNIAEGKRCGTRICALFIPGPRLIVGSGPCPRSV